MAKVPLNAVTLHRPWPYAVTHLGKRIENRSWPCPLAIGTLIAIHAGNKFDIEALNFIKSIVGTFEASLNPVEDPTGIVAIARFTGNVTASNSPWFVGPIGWELDCVTAIDPIPCRGHQGLWLVEGELLAKVRIAYERALYKR